jgi:hypothetical protein
MSSVMPISNRQIVAKKKKRRKKKETFPDQN